MARRIDSGSVAPERRWRSASRTSHATGPTLMYRSSSATQAPGETPSRTATGPGLPTGTPGRRPAGPPPIVTPPGRRRRRRRRSRGERLLRAVVISLALVLALVGAAYGYFRYRWSQIRTEACASCAAVTSGQPFNVLIVGSDSRAGDTGAAANAFGSASQVAGQRSDTIKILHVDPAAGTARLLSIPRDTYVTMSGLPASSGLTGAQKINTAFNDGPDPLVQTIANTFGISISHFVIIDFTGLINAVDTVHGVNLDFRYPARDNDDGNNNSGLDITHAGCQTLDGTTALALARSRYYEYEVSPGVWEYDGTGDLGRIQRQNAIIESLIDKAKGTYNPLTLNAFLGSVTQDVVVDRGMSPGLLLSLAEKYHGFSGSSLETYTLPTLGAQTSGGSDVEVVDEPAAQQVIAQFLGTAPATSTTPPLDSYGAPLAVPAVGAAASGASSSSGVGASPATPSSSPGAGPFNPTPC